MDENNNTHDSHAEGDPTAGRREACEVRDQFMAWPFPEPVGDLGVLRWKQYDIALDHELFWPERPYRSDLRILVAGCGTMEAAVVAHDNPGASVVGIDLSAASLEHQNVLARRHGLANLETHELDVLDVAKLGRRFDLIVSFGVVHHLPDPSIALSALREVLDADGVMLISVYGKYPRAGVTMVQEALRRLQARQDGEGIALARDIVAALPAHHPLSIYSAGIDVRKVGDTDIVDAYLNRHEHTFTVEDVLSFSRRAGLVFQGWWDNIDYYPEANLGDDPAICEAIARLPREAQWPVVELLAPRIGRHRFLLRADGDETSRLRIPFGSDEICSLVPSRRRGLRMARSGATGTQIAREWHRMTLRGWQENVFGAVDGVSTIAEITATQITGSTATISDVSWFVERLWRMGHVTLSRRPS